MRLTFFLSILFVSAGNFLSGQRITDISDTTVHASFRGMSAVNDSVVWVSGSKGTVGMTVNGGKTWSWSKVQNFENSDFRSIYAFDANNAVIASAGTPAVILTTDNGGVSWDQRFISNDSAMFFDGIDFWNNKHGLIFGDPVNGRMYLSETFDGGKTWEEIPFEKRPQLEKGEAAFAASGTTIRTTGKKEVWIATGGMVSRLWHSTNGGQSWIANQTPIIQGKPSTGIFSIALASKGALVIIGGDYMIDTLSLQNCFYTSTGGKYWEKLGVINPHGYKSCIALTHFEKYGWWFCTGTSGTELLGHYGVWENIGDGYNTISQAKKGRAVYFCGGNGHIGKFNDEGWNYISRP